MCIVVDTNVLSKVFKASDKQHSEFKPVLDWILQGNGKLVVGGTKFDQELFEKVDWFRKLFLILKGLNKVVALDTDKVDSHQKIIEGKKIHKDFDDPHIVALLAVSKCKLVCTADSRAFPFIRNRDLYPKRAAIPSIYTKKSNSDLLIDNNIAHCCFPKVKLPKRRVPQL